MILKIFFPSLLFIIFLSCSGVKLSQKIELGEGDWLMAGGTSEQKNIAHTELAPPLHLVWDRDIEAGVGYSGISAADAVIFVNSLAGEMICLDVATGGKIGTLGFLGRDASSTPLILGDNCIVTYAGDDKYSVASFNMLEDSRNWRKNYGYIQTSPVYKEHSVYFGSLTGNEYKINDSTGKLVWKYSAGEPIHSTCAVTSEYVLFGTDKGSFCCLNSNDGSEKWKFKLAAPIYSTPLVNNGTVFFGADDSNYYAINISDGSKIWSRNIKSKIVSGSTVCNDSLIIFGGINGYLYALDAVSGDSVWCFKTYGTITSSPLASGKYVYCTSFDSYIYCLDGSTGAMLWSYQFENKSRTTPVIWKNYLFAAADRTIYCFTNK